MELRNVVPATLRVSPSRLQGADPGKLWRQVSRYANSMDRMPPLQVVEGKDGDLVIVNGVTRATRIANFAPGVTVPIEIQSRSPNLDLSRLPTIKDVLP